MGEKEKEKRERTSSDTETSNEVVDHTPDGSLGLEGSGEDTEESDGGGNREDEERNPLDVLKQSREGDGGEDLLGMRKVKREEEKSRRKLSEDPIEPATQESGGLKIRKRIVGESGGIGWRRRGGELDVLDYLERRDGREEDELTFCLSRVSCT